MFMDKHLFNSLKDHNDKQRLLIETDNAEKQLWALIHSNGPLHSDVDKLYCKVRSSYEKLIMSCNDMDELHDSEYSMWKLHYKHIDEFRKRTIKHSTDTGITKLGVVQNVSNVQRSNDNPGDGFMSFLSEASQFYQSLILKIKSCYGLSEDAVPYKEGGMCTNLAPELLRKCQFLCHRFLLEPLDEFLCAFTSMMRGLDALMALNETHLKSALESYQCMDLARKGPFRTLHAVSVFIFIFEKLVSILEQEYLEPETYVEQLVFVQWALMVIFTFMGRLVDRCSKASPSDCSPLLPAILIFVEWLVAMLDKAETYATDGESINAMSHFFSVLSNFLNQIPINKGDVKLAENIPLWEDYNLIGFAPATEMHESLDFSSQCSYLYDYSSGNEFRFWRIVNAALKIANRANVSRKWICYEKLDRKFFIPRPSISDLKENEHHQDASEEIKERESHPLGENHRVNGMSISMEEEEIILFEPFRRYNSVPVGTSTVINVPELTGDKQDKAIPSDECLRHAASLLASQSRDHNSKYSKSLKKLGTSVNNTMAHPSSAASISAGPPSLSGWVINRGTDREKLTSDIFKYGLNTVEEEVATPSLAGISISDVTSRYYCPTYSAPLLPDDAVWFSGTPCDYPKLSFGGVNNTNKPNGVLQFNGYPEIDYGDRVPGYMSEYPSPLCGMTSSEWLRQYREHRNLAQSSNRMQQVHGYAGRSYEELVDHEYELTGCWGNPMAPNQFMSPPPSFVPLYGRQDLTGVMALRQPMATDSVIKQKEWKNRAEW